MLAARKGSMELNDYLPVLVMFVLAAGFVSVSVFLARFIANRGPASAEKLAPYECGIVPEVEPSQRFPVKFYLVAILFVIFDVEIIFLFAWAANFPELGWFGVTTVGIFTLFVLETLVYVWKRGALDWNVRRRTRRFAAGSPVPQAFEDAA
jgi:NADH-quinone oxidoreductase subunit A